jgi:hypothetical protein
MKTNLLKYYIAVIYFCSTFVMVAQPGTDNDTSDLEETDAVPIDDYVWVLAAIGLAYVFLRLRALYLQEKTSKE